MDTVEKLGHHPNIVILASCSSRCHDRARRLEYHQAILRTLMIVFLPPTAEQPRILIESQRLCWKSEHSYVYNHLCDRTGNGASECPPHACEVTFGARAWNLLSPESALQDLHRGPGSPLHPSWREHRVRRGSFFDKVLVQFFSNLFYHPSLFFSI